MEKEKEQHRFVLDAKLAKKCTKVAHNVGIMRL